MNRKAIFFIIVVAVIATFWTIGATSSRYTYSAEAKGNIDLLQTKCSLELYNPSSVTGSTSGATYKTENGTSYFAVPTIPTDYTNINYKVNNKVNNIINQKEIQYYIRVVAEDSSTNIPIEYNVHAYNNTSSVYSLVSGLGYGPFTLQKNTEYSGTNGMFSIEAKYTSTERKYATSVQKMKVQMITKDISGSLVVLSEAPLLMKYTAKVLSEPSPTISLSTSNWTNNNVNATASTLTGYTTQMSYDQTTWTNTNTLTFSSNGIAYARYTDGINLGTIASKKITNIDKTAPTISSFTHGTIASSTIQVSVSATDSSSEIKNYAFYLDGTLKATQSSTSYTYSGLNMSIAHTLKTIVTDNAGNTSSKEIKGYQIKNLIKNGSFEQGGTSWDFTQYSNNSPTIVSGGYFGTNCLRFSYKSSGDYTSMAIQESIGNPILNHKYYGSIMFKSSNIFTTEDSRFEWMCNDYENVGTLVFADKNVATSSWIKLSGYGQITNSKYLSNTWVIRNFERMSRDYSYCDGLLIVDLTLAF